MNKRLDSGERTLAPSASSNEVYDLPRVCAMFDKPYVARYRRGADGLLQLAGVVKVENAAGGQGTGTSSTAALSVRSQDIRSGEVKQERCPWCGKSSAGRNGMTHCSKCDSWVCSSALKERGTETHFECRPSCGNRADRLVDYDGEYEASPGTAPEKRDTKTIVAGITKPALPSTERTAMPSAARKFLKG